ncbi:MAG: hypothetical protein HY088_02025 [Ignavibacteriales bacterium]|nr:hypothetical protein [Ignavibacteriales bacterium]
MAQKFFELIGVDFVQWKALMKHSFRLANRQTLLTSTSSHQSQKGINYALYLSLFLYLIFGFVLIGFLRIPNPFWSSLFILSSIGVMIGSMMLIEFGSIIVAPEDYHIFSVQPVSSRTYFVSKMSFTLIYVSLSAAALGLPSVIGYGYANHIRLKEFAVEPALFVAALAALVMWSLTIAMSMILLYTYVLRYVNYRRLKNALSYLQLVMSFMIYGGYMIFPVVIEKTGGALPVIKPWWVFLIPVSWYSSLLGIANGSADAATIVAAFVGVLFFAGVIPLAVSKISLGYAQSLSEGLSAQEETKFTSSREATSHFDFMKHPEDRVVAKLIWNQFKYDTKFRLAVMGIIPITALYLFMGLSKGEGLFNPFNPSWESMGQSALLYVAIVLFPVMIKESATKSDSYVASWMFFVSPANKTRLVLSLKKALLYYFVIPYLLILGVIFSYYFRSVLHAAMHAVILVLLSQLLLQLLFLPNPQLPFSAPRNVGERITLLGITVIIAPILLLGGVVLLSLFVYQNAGTYLTAVVILAIMVWFMEKLLKKRISRKMEQIEFLG